MVENYLRGGFNPAVYGVGLPDDTMNDLGGLEKELKMGRKRIGFIPALAMSAVAGIGGILGFGGQAPDLNKEVLAQLKPQSTQAQYLEQGAIQKPGFLEQLGNIIGPSDAYAGGVAYSHPVHEVIAKSIKEYSPDQDTFDKLSSVREWVSNGSNEAFYNALEELKQIKPEAARNCPPYIVLARMILEGINSEEFFELSMSNKNNPYGLVPASSPQAIQLVKSILPDNNKLIYKKNSYNEDEFLQDLKRTSFFATYVASKD